MNGQLVTCWVQLSGYYQPVSQVGWLTSSGHFQTASGWTFHSQSSGGDWCFRDPYMQPDGFHWACGSVSSGYYTGASIVTRPGINSGYVRTFYWEGTTVPSDKIVCRLCGVWFDPFSSVRATERICFACGEKESKTKKVMNKEQELEKQIYENEKALEKLTKDVEALTQWTKKVEPKKPNSVVVSGISFYSGCIGTYHISSGALLSGCIGSGQVGIWNEPAKQVVKVVETVIERKLTKDEEDWMSIRAFYFGGGRKRA